MKIGIIGAMDKEIVKFNEHFTLDTIEPNLYKGNINNKELFVALSGIGKVNSAAITQHLIDKYNVDIIINTGCAGSLTKEVAVFDVVLASYVTYHDFTPERIMNFSVPNNGKPEPDDKLIKLAIDEIKKLNLKYHVKPICSGDCFVTSDAMRDEIKERTGCVAVDMESASIGHIAAKNNIPFLIIRTISDFADGQVEFEEKAGTISAEIVNYVAKEL